MSKPSFHNNFTMIRIMSSLLVFAGHLGMLLGLTPPLFGGISTHEVGVRALFIIGGYLVAQSWERDKNPLRYFVRRFFRLWPPFAVAVLLIMFVFAPFFSKYGVKGYFEGDYLIYLRNLRFYITYALPGVFVDLPHSTAVNGSFWTMPVEAFVYIILPVVITVTGFIAKKKRTLLMIILAVVLAVIDLYMYFRGTMIVVYATSLEAAIQLTVFFLAGTILAQPDMKKYLSLQHSLIGMIVLMLMQQAYSLARAMLFVILPWFVISFATTENPRFAEVGKKTDPSYGIYLYGFFFQQCIIQLKIWYNLPWNYIVCLVLSLIPTVIAGILSYKFIEKPSVKLGAWINKKLSA